MWLGMAFDAAGTTPGKVALGVFDEAGAISGEAVSEAAGETGFSIFGTANSHGAITLSGNRSFVFKRTSDTLFRMQLSVGKRYFRYLVS